MLDEIYRGEVGRNRSSELTEAIRVFQRDVLSTCRPFLSDEKIEDLFDELFDGFEVLPKSLMSDYLRLLKDDPLLAPGLLIPITRGQYFGLKSKGRLKKSDDGIWVADCPYTKMGLELAGSTVQDGI
jgi:hypothetical protein